MRRALAVLVVVSLWLPTSPASAQAQPTLHLNEVRGVVRTFLREWVAPTVKDNGDTRRVTVWRCVTNGKRYGSCHGRLLAGHVECRGTFRVMERRHEYTVWPSRMTCEDRRQ